MNSKLLIESATLEISITDPFIHHRVNTCTAYRYGMSFGMIIRPPKINSHTMIDILGSFLKIDCIEMLLHIFFV